MKMIKSLDLTTLLVIICKGRLKMVLVLIPVELQLTHDNIP